MQNEKEEAKLRQIYGEKIVLFNWGQNIIWGVPSKSVSGAFTLAFYGEQGKKIFLGRLRISHFRELIQGLKKEKPEPKNDAENIDTIGYLMPDKWLGHFLNDRPLAAQRLIKEKS